MSRSRFGLAVVVYALVMAYASTIVGVAGPHYVPIDWGEALQRLIHMRYVANGSDQRSDWMGNLVMAVPLGFLAAGWLSPGPSKDHREMSTPTAVSAFVLCLACIVAMKYAQLFFPPRTVTLNYVVAQSLGAGAGIFLLGIMRSPFAELGLGLGRLESLRIILRIYSGLLIVFMLMPLDFALNAGDLAAQFDKLPDTFTQLGGDGRPVMIQIALLLTSIAMTAPVGALLTLMNRGRLHVGRSTSAAAWMGFFIMLGIYVATSMVMSGTASLPTVAVRTAGIALGAWFMHWLTRQDPEQIRYDLGSTVPWIAPIYLLTLFGVNGLLSFDWTAPHAAAADFYDLGLWPLFNYYIVTKAQAAKNIVGHVVMYAPIGIMIWLRAKDGSGRLTAFVLAVVLSAIVEGGRFLRPGLVPDINAIPLAGVAAWTTAALMPALWQMLASVAIGRTVSIPLHPTRGTVGPPVLDWRDRTNSRQAQRRDHGEPIGPAIGDVEDY